MKIAANGERVKVTQLLLGTIAAAPSRARLFQGIAPGGVELSDREELHRIERRDNLTAGHQLLQVIAIA